MSIFPSLVGHFLLDITLSHLPVPGLHTCLVSIRVSIKLYPTLHLPKTASLTETTGSYPAHQGPPGSQGGEASLREDGREDAPQESRASQAQREAQQAAQLLIIWEKGLKMGWALFFSFIISFEVKIIVASKNPLFLFNYLN